jgi:hypothetical protein
LTSTIDPTNSTVVTNSNRHLPRFAPLGDYKPLSILTIPLFLEPVSAGFSLPYSGIKSRILPAGDFSLE